MYFMYRHRHNDVRNKQTNCKIIEENDQTNRISNLFFIIYRYNFLNFNFKINFLMVKDSLILRYT